MNEIVVNFKWNKRKKHDPEEFERQLKMQNEGLNNLTLEEYLTNRENFRERGRSNEGNKAQKEARRDARDAKAKKLRKKEGLGDVEAEIKANEWLKTKHALHSPDQIAGGNPNKVTGVGDKRVNASLGGQWRHRAGAFHDAMDTAIKSELRQFNLSEKLLNDILHGNFKKCPPIVMNHLQKTKPNISLNVKNEVALEKAIDEKKSKYSMGKLKELDKQIKATEKSRDPSRTPTKRQNHSR